MLASLADYVADPIGRTCGSARTFVWFPDPALRIICAWGTLDVPDAQLVMDATANELDDRLARHASLIDFRTLHGVLPEVHDAFLTYAKTTAPAWGRALTASTLVHREGLGALVSAAIAGYHEQFDLAYPVTWHTSVADAIARLGRTDLDPIAVERGIAERRAQAELEASFIQAVRAWLDQNLPTANADACAKALGTTARTLQRRMEAAGTAFRRETMQRRMDRAKALLAETDAKVFSIAADVGYAKLQSFTEAFRAATGVNPSAWREARRKQS